MEVQHWPAVPIELKKTDHVLVLAQDRRLPLICLHMQNVSDSQHAAWLQMYDELRCDVLDQGKVVVCHLALEESVIKLR